MSNHLMNPFGLMGGLLIIALVKRFWFEPRRAARQRERSAAQHMLHEARLKRLEEPDTSALEAWINKERRYSNE